MYAEVKATLGLIAIAFTVTVFGTLLEQLADVEIRDASLRSLCYPVFEKVKGCLVLVALALALLFFGVLSRS